MSLTKNDLLCSVEDDCLADYEKAVVIIAQRRVVELLWKNGTQSLSEITKKMNISLNALAAVYLNLSPLKVIERIEGNLQLTTYGRIWVIKNRKFLFMRPVRVSYKKEPNIAFRMPTSAAGKLPKSYRLKNDKP